MITVLTPTFNRAYLLSSAYESLCRQSSFSFEWIIVDDGSTDNTEQLCRKWIEDCDLFPIHYFKKENGGKHTAVNHGVQLAKFDYVLILDSDDYLEDNAIELIHTWIESIKGDDTFAGVAGLKASKDDGDVIGNFLSKDYVDATNLQRRSLGLLGDKAEVYKTSVLKKYPFPQFDNEKFLQESASWDRIASDGYKIRWFNVIVYRCNYLPDGLTRTLNDEIFIRNFKGFTYCTKIQIDNFSFIYKYYKIGYYAKVARRKQLRFSEIKASLKINFWQLIFGICLFRFVRSTKLLLRKLKRWNFFAKKEELIR